MQSDAATLRPPDEWQTVMDREDAQQEIRGADASKLSFPIQLVIQAVFMVLTVAGGIWTVKSDIRNLETKMDAQSQIAALQSKLIDERMSNQKDDIQDMKRRLELVQLQYQSLREAFLSGGKQGR